MASDVENAPGDTPSVLDARFYAELRELAARAFASERHQHTLQPTAVVNEACIRLMSSGLPDVSREHQLAIAGRVLQQVLIDHARHRDAKKRGSGAAPVNIECDLLSREHTIIDFDAVHAAIDRLSHISPRQAETVKLRIFSGLTVVQVATVLGVSKRTAEGDWTVARAWLRRELGEPRDERALP